MSKRAGDPGYAPGWCVHFRSMGRRTSCEAGVEYDSLGPREGSFHKLPCFTRNRPPTAGEPYHCDAYRAPTTAEVQAHEVWRASLVVRMGTVLAAIEPWRRAHKGQSRAEVIDCPICRGRLHLSIAGHNGHVHGRCETANCVEWME